MNQWEQGKILYSIKKDMNGDQLLKYPKHHSKIKIIDYTHYPENY